VLPIGGADMPVVISLLNSYAGLASAATGFALGNPVLIIAGALDGTSGLLLSMKMSKAMNRSFANVLFGAFGKVEPMAEGATGPAANYNLASVEDAVGVLAAAQSLIVVPGYGMAVSQAQHAVRELAQALEANGTTVKYAIHPVAGRMPGHMNVLLAEANVPYDQLYDLDDINDEFARTDVALVVGAGKQLGLRPILELQSRREIGCRGGVHGCLDPGVRPGRTLGQGPGHLGDPGHQLGVRDDLVDQPDPQRLRCAHSLPEQHHPRGPPGADQPGQRETRAGVGRQGDTGERHGERSRCTGHPEVAGVCEGRACAGCSAVHGGDHGLWHPDDC